ASQSSNEARTDSPERNPFLDPTLEPFTPDAPLSADDFARALRRERSRCDRLGDAFTTVTLRAIGSEELPVSKILAAMEPCEEIGWLDRRTLVLLMPHTRSEQAVKEIRRRFSSLAIDENVEIERRTYPTPGGQPTAIKGRRNARRAFSALVQRRRSPGFPILFPSPEQRLRKAGASGTLFSLISAITSLIFGR
ncbi:MAG: hypothetical protein AAF488_11980, partial [Planctomycetota bacterium]